MHMNSDPSNLNRRDFLSKSLAGAGAGLVLGAPNILRAATDSAGSDAIHLATARQAGAGAFVTNDRRLRSLPA